MSEQQVEQAKQSADNKDKEDQFTTVNFKKLYINSKEGIIQTEVLEIQTAPEIKEMINTALFNAAKKHLLPGRYYPYGISRSVGMEEYKNILRRQNLLLETTEIISIQGMTEEVLDSDFKCHEGDTKLLKTAREIITQRTNVLSLEKTNLSSERGKYFLIVEKKGEEAIKTQIDVALQFINDNADEKLKHPTHPGIRRTNTNRWSMQIQETQIQEYAERYQHNDAKEMPKKPPNAWEKK